MGAGGWPREGLLRALRLGALHPRPRDDRPYRRATGGDRRRSGSTAAIARLRRLRGCLGAASGRRAAALPREPPRVARTGEGGLGLVDELVAHPPDVDDEAAVGAERELPPEARRVRVERPRAAERPVAPDVAQQLVLREDPLRLRGEREPAARTPCRPARRARPPTVARRVVRSTTRPATSTALGRARRRGGAPPGSVRRAPRTRTAGGRSRRRPSKARTRSTASASRRAEHDHRHVAVPGAAGLALAQARAAELELGAGGRDPAAPLGELRAPRLLNAAPRTWKPSSASCRSR